MDDPAKSREEYMEAVLKHHHDIMEVGVHMLREKEAKKRKKQKRQYWIRPWIGKRENYGLYDKLMMELRSEDISCFIYP